jgi:hypothetical protein
MAPLPTLKKLFLNELATLDEADRRNVIVNKVGFPQEFADWAHELSNKKSLWIANTFKSVIEGEHPGIMNVLKTDGYDTKWDGIQNLGAYIQEKVQELEPKYRKVLEWARKEGEKGSRPDFEKLSIEDAYNLANEHEQAGIVDPAGEVKLTYSNGWYWVDLKGWDCPEEADAMNHCATAYDRDKSTLFSLRDKNRKSHVTIEVNLKTHTVRQCKGNSNKKPASEYGPYILDFLIKIPEVEHYDASDRSDWSIKHDFTVEQQRELEEVKPDVARIKARTLQGLIGDAEGGEIDFDKDDWSDRGHYLNWVGDNQGFMGSTKDFDQLNSAFDITDAVENARLVISNRDQGKGGSWSAKHDKTAGDMIGSVAKLLKNDPEAIIEEYYGNGGISEYFGWDLDNAKLIADKIRQTRNREWVRQLDAMHQNDADEANTTIANQVLQHEDLPDLKKIIEASIRRSFPMLQDFVADMAGFGKRDGLYLVHVGGYNLYEMISNYIQHNGDHSLPMGIEDLATGSDMVNNRFRNQYSTSDTLDSEHERKLQEAVSGNYDNIFDYFFNNMAMPMLTELTIGQVIPDDPNQLKFPFANLSEAFKWILDDTE